MTRFVTCALETIRRYNVAPEQIDFAILCAINATLCARSNGDDRVAEGFNSDIGIGGSRRNRALASTASWPPTPFPLSPDRLARRTVVETIQDALEQGSRQIEGRRRSDGLFCERLLRLVPMVGPVGRRIMRHLLGEVGYDVTHLEEPRPRV